MSMSEEMGGVEETKGDEPDQLDSRVLEDETPTTTGSFYSEQPSTVVDGAGEPSTPALAVAYPVPLATDAVPAPSGGLTGQLTGTLSEYIWGKPKTILRQAKNKQKPGLPDTEETHEYIQGYLWKKSRNSKTLKERKKYVWFAFDKSRGALEFFDNHLVAADKKKRGRMMGIEKFYRVQGDESDARVVTIIVMNHEAEGTTLRPLKLKANSAEEAKVWIDGLEEHRLAFHKAMIPLVRHVQRIVRGRQERRRHDMRVAKLERAKKMPFYGAVLFLVAGFLLMLRRHPAVQDHMMHMNLQVAKFRYNVAVPAYGRFLNTTTEGLNSLSDGFGDRFASYAKDPVVKINIGPGVTKMVTDVRAQTYLWSREMGIGLSKLKELGMKSYTVTEQATHRATEVVSDLQTQLSYYNHAAKFHMADVRSKFTPGVLHFNMKAVEDRAYHEAVVISKAVRTEFDTFKSLAKGRDQLKHLARIHTFNLLGEATDITDLEAAAPAMLRVNAKLFSANLEKKALQVMLMVQTDDNLDCKSTTEDSRCKAVKYLLDTIEVAFVREFAFANAKVNHYHESHAAFFTVDGWW